MTLQIFFNVSLWTAAKSVTPHLPRKQWHSTSVAKTMTLDSFREENRTRFLDAKKFTLYPCREDNYSLALPWRKLPLLLPRRQLYSTCAAIKITLKLDRDDNDTLPVLQRQLQLTHAAKKITLYICSEDNHTQPASQRQLHSTLVAKQNYISSSFRRLRHSITMKAKIFSKCDHSLPYSWRIKLQWSLHWRKRFYSDY